MNVNYGVDYIKIDNEGGVIISDLSQEQIHDACSQEVRLTSQPIEASTPQPKPFMMPEVVSYNI